MGKITNERGVNRAGAEVEDKKTKAAIHLDPRQQGDPLNYFLYPYAEVDGKPFALESKFSFRDQASGSD